MASSAYDGPRYDIDTFCGKTAQQQREEITRLADLLETEPGPTNNGRTRKSTYLALIDEYNRRDADVNPPALDVGNANLGPAVSMNGDQAVFEDFSLGAPTIPPPSKSLTVAQIKEGLRAMGVDIPQNVKKKAQLLKLYENSYPESPQFSPQSPQFSPQSPPMMGMDGSSR